MTTHVLVFYDQSSGNFTDFIVTLWLENDFRLTDQCITLKMSKNADLWYFIWCWLSELLNQLTIYRRLRGHCNIYRRSFAAWNKICVAHMTSARTALSSGVDVVSSLYHIDGALAVLLICFIFGKYLHAVAVHKWKWFGVYSILTHHMATKIWVNTGSSNGLLPDGTKPLPEPMSTDHQWSPVTRILGQFYKRYLNNQSPKSICKLHIYNFIKNSQGPIR